MNIVHHLDANGGFTVGDRDSGITCYAFPTSVYADQAKRDPAATAQEMLTKEVLLICHERQRDEHDKHNWRTIDGHGTRTTG